MDKSDENEALAKALIMPPKPLPPVDTARSWVTFKGRVFTERPPLPIARIRFGGRSEHLRWDGTAWVTDNTFKQQNLFEPAPDQDPIDA